ncbi:hypothetical protein [Vacuolonema iberomarrocanum]|uniref:hypothetical protein n=1 Tax=Vacuolonema iberomarrocanum TaxID=3454632 RepID=UPI0019EE4F54|nr:hypothetical protein [filamentous cyanobacterium LEGE 07170]
MLSLVRSLLLASFLAFLMPILLFAGVWTGLTLLAQIPALTLLSQSLGDQIMHFLNVFGSGNWLSGVLVIAVTCSIVGALFDGYIFFYHQYHQAVHHHPMQ